MRLGSFTLDSTTINVETDYDSISGMTYRFIRADNDRQVAVTTYRGIEVAADARFSKADLQRGLDAIRKTVKRR